MRAPRHVVIVSLVFALLSGLLAAEGQQAGTVYRVGYLGMARGPDGRDTRLDLFRKGLRDLGYREGENIAIETRYADQKPERFASLADELVGLKVDVILTSTGVAAVAAKKATETIPIVMWASGDAVKQGLAASLARPGGNVTGLTANSPDQSRKRLEILRETLPNLSRVGVVWCSPVDPLSEAAVSGEAEWAETQSAAEGLGLPPLSSFKVRTIEELPSAFASAAEQGVQAVLVFDCSRLHPSVAQIAELSLKHRLPTMCPFPFYSERGGLISYGANERDNPYRAATYVDKILKGAKPADLPVEPPRKFELIINLKTARALGLTIPASVLTRANKVIE